MIPKDNPTIHSDACILPEGYNLPARLPMWDCASTAHIVTSADILDNYHVSENPSIVSWGSADNSLNSVGCRTLLTLNHLPCEKRARMKFTNVRHVPGFGANLKHVTSSEHGCEVSFKSGAKLFDSQGELKGWSPEPVEYSDICPLILRRAKWKHKVFRESNSYGKPT